MGLAKYFEDNVELMEERQTYYEPTPQYETPIFFKSIYRPIDIPKKTTTKHKPKMIACCECSKQFLFTGGEQQYYEKHHLSSPKRCARCRENRKAFYKQINTQKEKQA